MAGARRTAPGDRGARAAWPVLLALAFAACGGSTAGPGDDATDGELGADVPAETAEEDRAGREDVTTPDDASPADDAGDGATCGDGTLDPDEECDGDAPRSCTTDCGSSGEQACVACRWEPCTPPEERCNGLDDDCDGETDEGCTPIGTPCTDDAPCASGGLVCNEAWRICVAPDCAGRPELTACETTTAPDRAFDICIGGSCVSPGCGSTDCTTRGPGFPPADTAQRRCFAANGAPLAPCPGSAGASDCGDDPCCGQDAQYGWDATHDASERFTRGPDMLGELTVTDSATGLGWQGCIAGHRGALCNPGAAVTMTWAEAVSYCDALLWAAASDWRLPDAYELQSLLHYDATMPMIDAAAFRGPTGDWTWTSTTPTGSSSVRISFGGGYAYPGGTGESYVRCVRGRPRPWPLTRFRRTEPIAEEPVVTDDATGTVWQGCVAGLTGTECATGTAARYRWQDALAYCQELAWAGFDDWYLPNATELLSLVDWTAAGARTDPAAFPGTPTAEYHGSSSTTAALPDAAWALRFSSGLLDPMPKNLGLHARCARSGP